MTTTPAQATGRSKFAVGQVVEVFTNDFTIPGFPRTWQRGAVLEVEPVEGTKLTEVMVRKSDGGYDPQRVGPNGGNKSIRSYVCTVASGS